MTKKHIVSSGASYGLAFGVVMFLVGLALAYRTDSVFTGAFMFLNAPAFVLLARLHDVQSYDWGSLAGLSQMLLAFLASWTLLGTLIGLGLQRFLTRKHHALAA
jgi:hypothetical protein